MEKFAFPYNPKRWYDIVKNDEPTEFEFLEETLKKDKESTQTVYWNILQQFIGEGAPSIYDFEVESACFTNKYRLKGEIEVEFVVNVYFCCDDMDGDSDRNDTAFFELNPQTEEITCNVVEPEKRSTFEEF